MLGQSGYSRTNDALRRLSNEVEYRPLVTVAVAVGVGILVGLASRSMGAVLTWQPTGPKILTFLTMSNVQQAIRDAAERRVPISVVESGRSRTQRRVQRVATARSIRALARP
jgi:hypothetical protein